MSDCWQSLIDALKKSGRQYDFKQIIAACKFAASAHEGQIRRSGEPYILHPIAVAEILADLGMDTDTIVAALLHDVAEDTNVTIAQIEKAFGKKISLLVDGVTKLEKLTFSSREEQQAENVRKMLIAVAQDVRVIIIKLADRLHNMRTISFMPEQKRRDKARETMEVYAPLAHRLGIKRINDELEDISIRILDNVSCNEIKEELAAKSGDGQRFIKEIEQELHYRLKSDYPDITIMGRIKSLYGIYRKVYIQGRSIDEVYDIFAFRIIVNSANDCYNILGVIHDMYLPIPSRFKDFISTPKPNNYQSLHTTVIDKKGLPFEVQIRTWDMHQTAEYGIAAHWKYKDGISGKSKLDEKIAWVSQLLEMQKESENVEDIVSSIKTDLMSDEVVVFTPKGEVKTLPAGSTVIDFAYAIHSAVGNRMNGAKIDGRIVPIHSQLRTGTRVEILTTKDEERGPSRDWLTIAKTAQARNKIRAWFKKERRDENIAHGKSELERELKRNLMLLPEPQISEFLQDVSKRMSFTTLDDLYASIGYGGLYLSKLMPRLREEFARIFRQTEEDRLEKLIANKAKKRKKAQSGVMIDNMDGCLIKFARCCNPLPGDEITGFITRGHGVTVHKKDCVNVKGSLSDAGGNERWVNAEWSDEIREKFKSTISIYAMSREGLLADISVTLANMHLQIHSLTARELKNGYAGILVTIAVNDIEQLNYLLSNIKKIESVIKVERSSS